jgi:hypothetical protein
MRTLLLTLFISTFCVFNISAQTFITPNASFQGTTLQVFISGSQSDFSSYSGCSTPYLELEHVQNQWHDIDVPNNVDNWQYNSNLGEYGFYSTITIPNDAYLGNYNLRIYDDWCWGTIQTYSNVFEVNLNSDPYLTNWSMYNYSSNSSACNDYGMCNNDLIMTAGDGDHLEVSISGKNFTFSQNSGTNNTDYRFIYSDTLSQNSGAYSFENSINLYGGGTNSNTGHTYMNGNDNFYIPNVPSGFYDLEVYDYGTTQWIRYEDCYLEVVGATITDIDPDYGNQGQTLSVTISGISMDYGSQWSGTLSDFRFSQWSGTSNIFLGTSTQANGNELEGNVTIPNGHPAGWYDLEVWDYGSGQWIMLEDAFEVIELAGPNNSLSGCMDSTADNYNTLAVMDDGSCFYCDITNLFYYSDPTSNSSCDGFAMASTSSNYPIISYNWVNITGSSVSTSNIAINLCNDTYIYTAIDSAGCTFIDIIIIGTIYGCTDTSMWNYNPMSNVDDGSCIPFIYGCTDSSMFNYNASANTEDSSCVPYIYGCTDPLALNYDASANSDDGSCQDCDLSVSLFVSQTSSSTACDGWAFVNYITSNSPVTYLWSNGNSSNNVTGLCTGVYYVTVTDAVGCTVTDSLYIGIIMGCTDSTAQNYNAAANIDDGSCCAAPVVDLTIGTWYFEYGWFCPAYDTLYYINYASNGTWSNSYSGEWQLCGDQYTHTYYNNPTVYTGTYNNGVITGTMNDGISTTIGCFQIYLDSTSVVLGCMDPLACNYDSTAQVSDGSCLTLYGCTDSLATNYDATATCDDGSCTYTAVCANSSITGLFISDIIDDQVLSNFDNMNTYDANGTQICRVDQIRIKYREVGTSTWSQKNIASPTGYDPITGVCNSTQKTDKPIRNLTPATEYEWQVKVWYCNGGNGGWTVGPNFTTLGECPNVGNLSVYGANPTKATFDWDDSNGVYEFVRLKSRIDSISNPTGSDWFLIGGAGVSYGTFTKNKNGLTAGETYRAQARTWCDPNGGAYNSLSWTSLVTWTQPASIKVEGGSSIANLDVYPNPSRDVFNISFTSENIQDLEVRVINLVGELIYTEDLQQFVGEYTKSISLAENAKGIYFLEIETNDGVINKKLILQ